MNVTIKNNVLVIEMPLQKPTVSKTGKNLVVATTHGIIKTTALVDGKPLSLGVNAFVAMS